MVGKVHLEIPCTQEQWRAGSTLYHEGHAFMVALPDMPTVLGGYAVGVIEGDTAKVIRKFTFYNEACEAFKLAKLTADCEALRNLHLMPIQRQ